MNLDFIKKYHSNEGKHRFCESKISTGEQDDARPSFGSTCPVALNYEY